MTMKKEDELLRFFLESTPSNIDRNYSGYATDIIAWDSETLIPLTMKDLDEREKNDPNN